jgi:hypothetical protein
MTKTRRIITFLGLTLALAATPGGYEDHHGRTVSIEGATADEVALVEWAAGRFQAAGLELPDLTVEFHDDLAGCKGAYGLYRVAGSIIKICNRGGMEIEPRHTILHELAHAWKFENLTEEETTAFTHRRGLKTWNAHEQWWQMGREQAAEIMAWGLVDEPLEIYWLQLEPCDDLAADFEALTGRQPLNDFTESCRA